MRPTARTLSLVGLSLLAAACSQPVVDDPNGKQVPASAAGAATPDRSGEVGRDTADIGRDVNLVGVAEGYVRRLTALLEDVQRRRAQGAATSTDVAQVEARLAQARARLATAKGDLARSRARYKEVVGQPAPGEDP